LPPRNKYHPNPGISKIKNRIVDRTVGDYAEFFYRKCFELDKDI